MALPKLFQRIFWHNNTTPAINETNLNAMSKGLSDVDDRLIGLAGTIMEDVPQIIEDMAILGPAVENIDENVARAEAATESAEQYAEEIAPPIEVVKDYADIITIEDAINKPVKDLKVKVDPVQDLHGYTKPWVGGAGKNLLNNQASTSTVQGIKYTVNSDKSITIANTATAQSVLTLSANDSSLPAGTYIYSKGSTNADVYCNINAKNGSTFVRNIVSFNTTSEQSFTLDYNGYDSIDILIYVPSGKAPNTTIYPMVRLSTVADASYEPYENICPISGWDNAKVTRAGKNLFDGTLQQGYYDNVNFDLTSTSDARYRSMKVWLKAGQYVISWGASINLIRLIKDNTYTQTGDTNITSYTVTLAKDGYLGLSFRNNANTSWDSSTTIQVEIGSTATAYEPYQGEVFTIDLDDTRYGGTLDVTSGVLTLTHEILDAGNLNYTKYDVTQGTLFRSGDITNIQKGPATNVVPDIKCSNYATVANNNRENGTLSCGYNMNAIDIIDNAYSDAATFKTAMSGVQVVYPLATPQTIQLAPEEIELLFGYNTLFADTGDLSLTYDASGVLRIANAKLDIDTFKSIVAASSDFADFKTRVAAL